MLIDHPEEGSTRGVDGPFPSGPKSVHTNDVVTLVRVIALHGLIAVVYDMPDTQAPVPRSIECLG